LKHFYKVQRRKIDKIKRKILTHLTMENTKQKENISPILVIVLIGLTLNLVMALGMIENWISPKDFIWVLVIIYSLVLTFGAFMSQVDTWLTRYEQNRYRSQLNRIQTDEILFEQVLKRETYKGFRKEYLNDAHRREVLVRMVAKLRMEFETGVKAEAKAIVEKERNMQTDNSISPIENFLDKTSNPKKSLERAAKIFKNKDNPETKPPQKP
jgi:hypothetical protein